MEVCHQEPEQSSSVNSFNLTIFVFPDGEVSFIGLEVQVGFGLVDTGAQHGVCGQAQFLKLVAILAQKFGLKPI